MHVAFILYGKRECVERLLRDMEAQKHLLPMIKNGKQKALWIDAQVRIMPFGVVEYVFPKEDLDIVLSTLNFNSKVPYGMGKAIYFLRKFLRYKKAPKYNDDKKYLWVRDNVSILPIGIRYDGEIVGLGTQDNGWKHEAI